ncbi:MAG: endonuclease MutS2 [Clostridium sp.]|nr:endonuclease MutS2 [Clostridium sp.]
MYQAQRYFHTLELDKVLAKLADQANCDDSKRMALSLTPSDDFSTVQLLMKKTSDAYMLSARYTSPSLHKLKNCEMALRKAEKGSNLSLRELMDVSSVLHNIRSVKDWRKRCEGESTSLDPLFEVLTPNRELENTIDNAVLSEEELADSASAELASLRRKINQAKLRVRERLDQLIKSPTQSKYLQEALVTQRDGRFVVPVKSEYRSEIKGLVHDTSSSGATLFIEPMAVVEANNEIRVLQAKEKQEVDRIIMEFSVKVGEFAESIIYSYRSLVEIDLYFAKASLAYKMKATVPNILQTGEIDLKRARHPLIDPEKVVPIDVNLGKDFNTLVITGPNTGGKTVTLKTMGLLTLMAMCGLMLPVAENSSISVYKKVLVDIGDEQSIEQSLSTFSAHMTNIVSIIEEADSDSLVLIDELGSGTDPVEGAALAISIMERLAMYGAKVGATTHYAEIKEYALQTPGVCNASCEFDVETLKPTYRLLIGIPGKSNAFAISQRLGLPEEIIEAAKRNISAEKTRFEDVLSQLDQTRQELEKEKEEVDRLRAEQLESKRNLEQFKQKTYKQMDRELQNAQEKANRIVSSVKAESEKLLQELDDIRRQKESEEFSRLVQGAKSSYRSNINRLEDTANPVIGRVKEEYTPPRPFKKGDLVLITQLNEEGVLLSDPDNAGNVQVQAGIIKTKVPVSDLRLVDKKRRRQLNRMEKKSNGGGVTRTLTDKSQRSASSEIDLRGQTIEEGIMMVDQYIDSCLLMGIKTITIIHGKGTGALRNAIQQHLKNHKAVRSFRLGVYGEGENGVTIAELK